MSLFSYFLNRLDPLDLHFVFIFPSQSRPPTFFLVVSLFPYADPFAILAIAQLPATLSLISFCHLTAVFPAQ